MSMKRLTIDELIAHCSRQMERVPSGSIYYQEHESVRAYLQTLRHYQKAIGPGYDLDRLRELVEADREGRVLPVKVSDRFYDTITGEVLEESVTRIIVDSESIRMSLTNFETTVTYRPEIFGKWLFRSREEAEAALKAREGDG